MLIDVRQPRDRLPRVSRRRKQPRKENRPRRIVRHVWPSEASHESWGTGRQLVWLESRGHYRINIGIDYELDRQRCPFIACVLDGAAWRLVAKHGSLAAAKRGCEQHDRRNGGDDEE